jgi:hypothetical protein
LREAILLLLRVGLTLVSHLLEHLASVTAFGAWGVASCPFGEEWLPKNASMVILAVLLLNADGSTVLLVEDVQEPDQRIVLVDQLNFHEVANLL